MMLTWLSLACLAAAGAGCAHALAAAWLAGRFARRPAPAPARPLSVTILKPLHGDEPGLFDNLASFCTQDYPGEVQVVLGVRDPADPALPAARRIVAAFPDRAPDLVIDPREHGANRKVSNLVNMAARPLGEVVVLADSDMRVEPDVLARVVGELERPGVGAVTLLYHGLPAAGLWSRLAALAIDAHFLPNVIVGVSLGLARPCFGSLIALRRETLDRIGGFAGLADRLADDHALGEAVRALGLRVAIPPFTIGHVCAERSLGELLRHELRWARTIRAVDPRGHAGSIVTHPLPLALLGAALAGLSLPSLAVAATALACRIGLCVRIERAFGLAPHALWLVPARDLLSFAVFCASLAGGGVSWRGRGYRVGPDGTLVPLERGRAP